jgi:Heavy metal associated domain 2
MNMAAVTPSGLRIAHHHPGRLRVRAEAFVGSAPCAEKVRSELVRMRGVRSVGHDARTGSLLVEYEPRDINANELLARIEELSGIDLVDDAPSPGNASLRIRQFMRKLDCATRSFTGSRLDLGVLVPGGLVGVAVYSFFKSSHTRLPRWDNLAYWAYSIFVRHTHASEVRPPP